MKLTPSEYGKMHLTYDMMMRTLRILQEKGGDRMLYDRLLAVANDLHDEAIRAQIDVPIRTEQ